MTKVTELVLAAVEPIIAKRNDELVDIEYVKEKGKNYLRLYVDSLSTNIDIVEIANLSELISEKLDTLDPDPFPDPYILEVSSPGIERPIKTEKDWQKALNSYVHVGLYQKVAGEKMYEGILKTYTSEQIELEIKIKTSLKVVVIPRKVIANIRFAVEF